MISTIFGLASVALGFWGICAWSSEFLIVLKGLVPVSLFFAGIVAVIVGLSRLSAPPPPPKDHGKA
jgi:hypothetical protein